MPLRWPQFHPGVYVESKGVPEECTAKTWEQAPRKCKMPGSHPASETSGVGETARDAVLKLEEAASDMSGRPLATDGFGRRDHLTAHDIEPLFTIIFRPRWQSTHEIQAVDYSSR